MRIFKTLLYALFVLVSWIPSHGIAAGESTRAVVKAIAARDCASAVKELNVALAGGSSEALLMGGAMFEQGLCLKTNLERAARLYQRAADTGAGGARARLAALYASPAAGPDKGTALWWAMQAGLPLPGPCVVASDKRGSPELFIQSINTWSPGLLDACVHVTGVVAALDAEFVLKPSTDSSEGVIADFRPAESRFDAAGALIGQSLRDGSVRVTEAHSMSGVLQSGSTPSPDQLRAQQLMQEVQDLAKRVESVGRDAIGRFPKPSLVDKDWRIQLRIESVRVN
jgi:hypothetical protein